MSILDNIKKATGVGLSHEELYGVAFEKGVLLGPTRFAEAAQLFDKAAQKAGEAGDGMLQVRAFVNARLYAFIAHGDVNLLQDLSNGLAQLPQLEQIGSQTQFMPADSLKAEIDARMQEAQLAALPNEAHMNLAAGHLEMAQRFKPLFNTPLITYKYQSSDQHVESGQGRFFYHQALSQWHEALRYSKSDPERAAENMAKAANAFTQCHEATRAQSAQDFVARMRKKRTCWVCHREMQGAGVHYQTYDATVTPYVVELVRRLGHDPAMLDADAGQAVLCTVCGSVVEKAADRVATKRVQELRAEVAQQIATLNQAVKSMSNRMNRLPVTR